MFKDTGLDTQRLKKKYNKITQYILFIFVPLVETQPALPFLVKSSNDNTIAISLYPLLKLTRTPFLSEIKQWQHDGFLFLYPLLKLTRTPFFLAKSSNVKYNYKIQKQYKKQPNLNHFLYNFN